MCSRIIREVILLYFKLPDPSCAHYSAPQLKVNSDQKRHRMHREGKERTFSGKSQTLPVLTQGCYKRNHNQLHSMIHNKDNSIQPTAKNHRDQTVSKLPIIVSNQNKLPRNIAELFQRVGFFVSKIICLLLWP